MRAVLPLASTNVSLVEGMVVVKAKQNGSSKSTTPSGNSVSEITAGGTAAAALNLLPDTLARSGQGP